MSALMPLYIEDLQDLPDSVITQLISQYATQPTVQDLILEDLYLSLRHGDISITKEADSDEYIISKNY